MRPQDVPSAVLRDPVTSTVSSVLTAAGEALRGSKRRVMDVDGVEWRDWHWSGVPILQMGN